MRLLGAKNRKESIVPPHVKKEFLSGTQGCKLTMRKGNRMDLGPTKLTNEVGGARNFMKELSILFGIETRTTEKENIFLFEISHREKKFIQPCQNDRVSVLQSQAESFRHPSRIPFTLASQDEKKKKKLCASITKYSEDFGMSGKGEKRKARELKNGKYFSIIESITKIETPERVYDFTTVSENHSLIANGIVISNCPAETPEGESWFFSFSYMVHSFVSDFIFLAV